MIPVHQMYFLSFKLNQNDGIMVSVRIHYIVSLEYIIKYKSLVTNIITEINNKIII